MKELSRADPALEYDVVEESGSKSGAEIVGMVRARLELEKNSCVFDFFSRFESSGGAGRSLMETDGSVVMM